LTLPPNKRHLAQETSVVRDQCLVVDGGATGSAPIPRPSTRVLSGDKRPWIRLSIAGGDLHIIDCKDPHLGVSLVAPSGSPPPFIRLPRHASINRTGMDNLATSSRHCQLLKRAEGFSKKNLVRGASRHIFSTSNYVRLGAVPRRSATGNGISKEQSMLSKNDWSELCTTVTEYEKLYRAFIPTAEVRRLSSARSIIDFPSLKASVPVTVSGGGNGDTFSSLAFCKNAHANVHVDSDMCQGLVVLHQPGVQYLYRQHILAYFCFPCHGVAVPLRPGDAIIFNPCEPHCLSSPVDLSKESYSVAMYLKTSVVGLNNNSLPLTDLENYVYHNI
jgi:hypothetical protein